MIETHNTTMVYDVLKTIDPCKRLSIILRVLRRLDEEEDITDFLEDLMVEVDDRLCYDTWNKDTQ